MSISRILILSLALLVVACSRETPAPSAPTTTSETEQPTPTSIEEIDFVLPTLEGDTLRLSDLRGKLVLLNFWATWCAPCRVEMPEFVALREELGPRGFEVIGVSMDLEGFEVVRPFAEELGITFPLVVGDQPLADRFGGLFGLPTTFIIGPDGELIRRVVGRFPTEGMKPLLMDSLPPPV